MNFTLWQSVADLKLTPNTLRFSSEICSQLSSPMCLEFVSFRLQLTILLIDLSSALHWLFVNSHKRQKVFFVLCRLAGIFWHLTTSTGRSESDTEQRGRWSIQKHKNPLQDWELLFCLEEFRADTISASYSQSNEKSTKKWSGDRENIPTCKICEVRYSCHSDKDMGQHSKNTWENILCGDFVTRWLLAYCQQHSKFRLNVFSKLFLIARSPGYHDPRTATQYCNNDLS